MQNTDKAPGDATSQTPWRADAAHRDGLRRDARRQLAFFRPSLRRDGGFDVLDLDGTPMARGAQELHTTTRMVHAYAMGHLWGAPDCTPIIDAGMAFLWHRHRDAAHGGYVWSVADDTAAVADKLAYGHVFVLLAGASAKLAGHADADRLIADVSAILDAHFWDEDAGLLRDEFRRDWQPFSTYRGMNSNMHGTEAMLAAFEATGEAIYLERAGRMLDFFVGRMAPAHGFRLPEHYHADWSVDLDYAGDPMFRPRGTTPGHSFEFARLALQHWDLCGRPDSGAPERARRLIETALKDAWLADGGLAYTLDYAGKVQIADRYWWPVTEAIGAVAALLKCDPRAEDEAWYRRLWQTASALFIDHDKGGWFPEIDAAGQPAARQFAGKPDIYHALQADLLPLLPGLSRAMDELAQVE